MKLCNLLVISVVIELTVGGLVSAETFIVGGSLLNGDFNATGLPLPPGPAEDFATTPNWTNFGSGGSTQTATDFTQNADQGYRNAVIFDQPARRHGLETGYTIQEGDVFNTNYVWRPSNTWDAATDEIAVRLFTTDDDTAGGVRTDFATVQSGTSFTPFGGSNKVLYQTSVHDGFHTVGPAALEIGRKLFVEVDGVDGNASDGFARLDNFELSVGPVGAAAPFLEFNAASNPVDGTTAWEPNIDTFGPYADSKPLELFTFSSAQTASAVMEPAVPGITASYSQGGQGRNFFNGASNQDSPNYATQGPGFQLNGEAPVSFEVWFKPDSLTGGDQIIAEFGGGSNGSYISLSDDTVAFHTKSLFQYAGELTLTAPALTDADWTQVVATWDGGAGEFQLFVNGQSVDSSAGTPLTLWAGGNAFGLGRRGESDGDPGNDIATGGPLTEGVGTDFDFAGEIGLFRIYNKALNAARVGAAFDAIASSVVTGDFDGNGLWDCADINALAEAVATASSDLAFDMNGDGAITAADVTDAGVGWLAVGGANNPDDTGGNPFLEGDATLDGVVDGQDFVAWNNNKFTNNTDWCDGNFNLDLFVDGQDFVVWNNNKFMSSDHVAVPEPSALPLVLMVMLFAWRPSLRSSGIPK